MATTIQHNPVLLQQSAEDEDVALATFLTNSLRFNQPQQDIWNYQQQQQQQQSLKQHRTRTRVSSNSSQPRNLQKSTSTPISTNNNNIRHNNGRKYPPSNSTSRSYNSSNPPLHLTSSESTKSTNSRRKSSHSVMGVQQQDRRPSLTGSVTSTVSIQSEMSTSSKLSISKKLRKVFSIGSFRNSNSDLASLAEKNGSSSSVASSVVSSPLSKSATSTEKNPMSFRRRSIASLSSLFQKGNASVNDLDTSKSPQPQPQQSTPSKKSTSRRHSSGNLRQLVKEDKRKPDLRVDTSENHSHTRKGGLKARSTTTTNSTVSPDSPNSAVSSRSSFSRLPPPSLQQRHFTLQEPGLPSPTPSTASNFEDDQQLVKPTLGLHYGIGLHGSPRLKPAASSTSSLAATERRIQFCTTIQIHETFSAGDYDRRCDNNATCQKLTPMMAMKIKQELNEYKLSEMEVHVESRQYTHFFL